jgi:hypothetical protein
LSHSEIHGSKLVRSSPWLIAAYHVLHRLLPPRHPPNALKSLDRSHYQCSPLGRGYGALTKRPDHSEKNPAPVAVATDGQLAPACAGPGKSPFHDFQIDLEAKASGIGDIISETFYLPAIVRSNGGACRDRTDDLKLAKLPLSQLS